MKNLCSNFLQGSLADVDAAGGPGLRASGPGSHVADSAEQSRADRPGVSCLAPSIAGTRQAQILVGSA